MTDLELKEIISQLRQYTFSERQKNTEKEIDIFFINVIEIACNLTEMALYQKRQISAEEGYWFNGSYHMNYWNPTVESDLYTPLVAEVKRRNWFG